MRRRASSVTPRSPRPLLAGWPFGRQHMAMLPLPFPEPPRGGVVVTRISLPALCAVVVSLASVGRLAAQGGTIRGHVADSAGAPLARATVRVEPIGLSATTNDRGDYEIKGVPTGTHTLRARFLGYVAQTVRVTVSDAQPTRQDFSLRVQPIGLAPVDVVVGSRARHTAADELAVPVDVFTSE